MLELLDQTECLFDFPQEVKEKIANSQDKQRLISEETIGDLKRVYVSKRVYCKIKRLMDIVLSATGLVILSLPLIIVAVAIYMDDPGSVLFSQYRIGRNGKRFKLYKFRTMRMDTPKYLSTMEMTEPDKYITRVGHFLRRMSLDEFPQLINVLKGDMSLVGPRPLIADEYEIHAMRMRFGVYSIRPGITGLAQIHGRDLVTPADKVRWDVKYLQEFGLWEDVKILIATIPKVLGRSDIVEGQTTAAKAEEKEPVGVGK